MPKPTADYFARLGALVAIDDAASRPTRPVVEAFSGTEMATIPVATADDLEVAVARARQAQEGWAARTPADRAAIIDRFSDLVHRNAASLMDIAQAETGKARIYAQEEVIDVSITARHYATNGPKLLADRKVKGMLPGATSVRVRYLPKGVVGIISPWNYPLTLAVSDAVAALIAGNGVVIKPDIQTPYCALALAELLYEAGLPPSMLSTIVGSVDEVVTPLIADDRVELVSFTGSVAIGKTISRTAGYKKLCLELGGNSPLIVLDAADLDLAVTLAAEGCFRNSGQRCTAVKRLLIHEAVLSEFTEAFVAKLAEYPCGDPADDTTRVGTVIDEPAAKLLEARVEKAVASGARVRVKWKALPPSGTGVIQMRPPCASMMVREIDRPRPMPSFLVVANAWNKRSVTAGLTPLPLS